MTIQLDTAFASAVVVTNPVAGGASTAVEAELIRRCEALRIPASTVPTLAPGSAVDAVRAAVARASDDEPLLVVAVGGDGTVREVAEGIARGLGRWPGSDDTNAHAALFVVPAGSGNSAYRELWTGVQWARALEGALADGRCRVHEVDLIRIAEADRASLLGVNAGLIASIARIIERDKLRERAGAGARPHADPATGKDERYWRAAAEALNRLELFPTRVTVDGRRVFEGDTTLVTIGGVRCFGGGGFELLPRSQLDDGMLDLCVIGPVAQDRLGAVASLVATGQHLDLDEVTYVKGRTVELERLDGRDLLIEHDGDPRAAGSRLTLEVLPAAVPVLVPAEV